MSTSFGWEGKGRYGSFRYSGWTRGVQVKLRDPLRTRAIREVCSRRGAIQIHVYLTLPCLACMLDVWSAGWWSHRQLMTVTHRSSGLTLNQIAARRLTFAVAPSPSPPPPRTRSSDLRWVPVMEPPWQPDTPDLRRCRRVTRPAVLHPGEQRALEHSSCYCRQATHSFSQTYSLWWIQKRGRSGILSFFHMLKSILKSHK